MTMSLMILRKKTRDQLMLDQAMKSVLVKAALAKQKASLYKHNVMGLFS